MAVSDGQLTAQELRGRLREKPLSELTEELEKLSSISDCDVDLLCAYLDVLEEKAPVLPEGFDPATRYEMFKETHSELFDAPLTKSEERTPPKKRRFLRVKQVLVSFAALFCVVVMVADASGAGVLSRLIEWGTETFSLRPASGVMELETAGENGFRSLRDALEYYNVEDPAIPTWIPEQYAIERITVLETKDYFAVSGKFVADNKELFVRISIPFEETTVIEEDITNEHTVYTTNGIAFILSKNLEMERATWDANGCAYSITGKITEKELKKMLGTIQTKE